MPYYDDLFEKWEKVIKSWMKGKLSYVYLMYMIIYVNCDYDFEGTEYEIKWYYDVYGWDVLWSWEYVSWRCYV